MAALTTALLVTATPAPALAATVPESTAGVVSTTVQTAAQVARIPTGRRIATLVLPRTGQTLSVYQGVTSSVLRRGVGHLRTSGMPGRVGNCVLSAHRTSYFRRLGRMRLGDRVIVKTSTRVYTYKVIRIRIIPRTHKRTIAWALRSYGQRRLTLTTCYPFVYSGHAPKRYLVITRLVSSRSR